MANILDYLSQALTQHALEDFCLDSILTKQFCLGEKQGVLVNNECGSWYKKSRLVLNVRLG